jgi:zinc carboxypeptidase/pre-peptidase
MRSICAAAAIAAVVIIVPVTTATGSLVPGAAAPTERTLVADAAVPRTCHSSLRPGARGVAVSRWTAPASGFLDVRSAAHRRGDWDLVLFDSSSGHTLATSEAFGSHEVAQTWVGAGQRVAIQGCHRTGGATDLPVRLQFIVAQKPDVPGKPSLVRVQISGAMDVARLNSLGLDVTHDVQDGHAIVHLTGAPQEDLLEREGFKFKTLIPDMEQDYLDARRADRRYTAAVDRSPLPSGRTTYRRYGDYQTEMKKLVESRPSLIRPVTLPERSWQGRPIQGVELAQDVRAKDDGRPVYFVMGEHHAREWPSAEIAMEFARYLAQNFGPNPTVTSLLKRERVVIVPIVNVDGFISSRNAFDLGDEFYNGGDPDTGSTVTLAEAVANGGNFAYRRKNCDGEVPSPAFPCELQYGIDPNRNYGEGWGGPGASSSPNTQTYRGSGPWSEPETQAVHEYSQTHQVTALLTLHNFASLVLRPPSLQSKGLAPDEDRLKQLGDEMAADTGYTSQYGWQLYDTSGTTEDWNYAAAGTYGYTIELGPAADDGGNFHVAYKRAVVHQWTGTPGTPQQSKGMRAAMLTLARAAANPADHAVIQGTAPPNRVLRLHKSFQTRTAPICEVSDPALLVSGCTGESKAKGIPDELDTTLRVPPDGTYTWHVGPSTRPFVLEKRVGDPGTKLHGETVDGQVPEGAQGLSQPNNSVDHEFQVTDPDTNQVRISLDWGTPDDLDLYVYRKDGDKLKAVGQSTGSFGDKEGVVVDNATAGTYVARVVNYTAVPGNSYTLSFDQYEVGPDVITPGRTEAWVMSCETPSGKVLQRRAVTVLRGEVATANFGCGGG